VGYVERTLYAQAGGKKELLRGLECENRDEYDWAGGGSGIKENYGSSERWRWRDYVGKQVAYWGGGSTEQHM
jgi:hypothetical protein